MHQLKQIMGRALFLALAGVAFACGSPAPAPPAKETAAPKPITAEERIKWYQDCWTDFNERKWDAFTKCYGDSATSQQWGYGKTSVTGAAAIVAASQEFSKSSPDGRGQPQLILVNGNHLASFFLLTGTNTGPLVGPDGKEMPATNKPFGLLFGHSIEVYGASPKVVKELGVMDGGTFASQLGLSKAPARPVMQAGAAAPKIVIAKNDDTEMKNLEAERAQFAAWNKHDVAAVDTYFADDFVLHDATQPKDQTKAQNSDTNKGFWKADLSSCVARAKIKI